MSVMTQPANIATYQLLFIGGVYFYQQYAGHPQLIACFKTKKNFWGVFRILFLAALPLEAPLHKLRTPYNSLGFSVTLTKLLTHT